MSHGRPGSAPLPEPSINLHEGWHCSHFYYSFDRALLSGMSSEEIEEGCRQLIAILDPEAEASPSGCKFPSSAGTKPTSA